MTITTECDACFMPFEAHSSHAGKRVKCPSCGSPVRVPAAGEEAGPEAAESTSPPKRSASGTAPRPRQEGARRTVRGKKAKTSSSGTTQSQFPAAPGVIASVAIGIGLLVLTVAAGAWFGPGIWRGHQESSSHRRIAWLLDEVAANGILESDAPARLEEELAHLSTFAETLTVPADQERLADIVAHLPPEAALGHLIDTPAQHFLFPSAVALAKQRDTNWLIEQSCDDDENVRRLAAEALTAQLPTPVPALDPVARLVALTSLEEQQAAFAELFAASHQAAEERLCGSYRIRIEAEYCESEATRKRVFVSQSAPLTISCADRTWTVRFLSKEWTGPIEDLTKLRLEVPGSETSSALEDFALLDQLGDKFAAVVSIVNGQVGVEFQGLPQFEADGGWRNAVTRSPGYTVSAYDGPGWTHTFSLPGGAQRGSVTTVSFRVETWKKGIGDILIEASGNGFQLDSARWKKLGRAGFRAFLASMERTESNPVQGQAGPQGVPIASGSFALNIEGAYKTLRAGTRSVNVTSRPPPLSISSDGDSWLITCAGQRWKGKRDALSSLKLEIEMKELAAHFQLLPGFDELAKSRLTVVWGKNGPESSIAPIPRWSEGVKEKYPNSTSYVYFGQKDGYTELKCRWLKEEEPRAAAGDELPVFQLPRTSDAPAAVAAPWKDKPESVVNSPGQIVLLAGHAYPVHDFALLADSNRLWSASEDGTARMWDLHSGREIARFVVPEFVSGAPFVDVSADGLRAVTAAGIGTDRCEVRLWDLSTGMSAPNVWSLEKQRASVGMSLTDRNRFSFIYGYSKPRPTLVPSTDMRYRGLCVSISPDAHWVAITFSDRKRRIYDTTTGDIVLQLWEPFQMAFTPDGRLLVAGDRTIEVGKWKPADGNAKSAQSEMEIAWLTRRPLRLGGESTSVISLSREDTPVRFSGHEAGVTCVDFSDDGKFLATGSNDGTVRVWDVASGDQLDVFRCHPERLSIDEPRELEKYRVLKVAMLSDGERLISTDAAGGLRVWKRTLAKAAPPASEAKPEDGADEENASAIAAAKLKLAKRYLERDSRESARRLLEEIVTKYPDTESAKEAAALLSGL